jgi:hypothetical protein
VTVTLAVLGVLILLFAWFLLSGRDDAPEPTIRRQAGDEIDHAELEQAERDVQQAPDEDSVRDWGPGVRGPPMA